MVCSVWWRPDWSLVTSSFRTVLRMQRCPFSWCEGSQRIVFKSLQVFLSVWGMALCSALWCCCVMPAALRMALSTEEGGSGVSCVLNGLGVRDRVVPLFSSTCRQGSRKGDRYTRGSVHPEAFVTHCQKLQQTLLRCHKPRSWPCLHRPALPWILLTCMNTESWNSGSSFQSSWSWE